MTKLHDTKPFIIAEVGSNWDSFEHCKDAISLAKNCGADAVKFQAFTYNSLYGYSPWRCDEGDFGPDGETCKCDNYGISIACEMEMSELPLDWLPKLKEKADACGIEFMCTAFSPELVDTVDPFVEVHKVASSDNCYPQLLDKIVEKGKPILLSCGATGLGDIRNTVGYMTREGRKIDLTLLYCASAYPSKQHNLFRMEALKKFGYPVGYSDHSLDVIYGPLSAVKHFGATVIEKHVNFFGVQGPDSPHSLNTDEFKIMCDYLKGKRDHLEFNPTPEEKDMFLRHNRRLIATRDISPGDVLRFGVNFGAYRSLQDDDQGLFPFAWDSFAGRTATKAIACGKGISLTDIQ